MNLLSKQTARLVLSGLFLLLIFSASDLKAQQTSFPMQYHVSPADPAKHLFEVKLTAQGWDQDTLDFKMPNWTPGYYQLMNYSEKVSDFQLQMRRASPFLFKN